MLRRHRPVINRRRHSQKEQGGHVAISSIDVVMDDVTTGQCSCIAKVLML